MDQSNSKSEISYLDSLITAISLRDGDDAALRALDRRDRAAWSLLELGDPKGVNAVVSVLADRRDDFRLRVHLANYIGIRLVEPGFSVLVEIAGDKSDNTWVRTNAVSAFRDFKRTSVVGLLIGILQDQGEPVDLRCVSAYVLGELRDVRALDPLIHGLDDSIPKVQSDCAEALALLGDIQAMEPLRALLVDRSRGLVRTDAIRALARIAEEHRQEWVLDTLFEFLTNEAEDWYVREASALALVQLGDRRAFGVLIGLLSNPDSSIRSGAANVLNHARDSRAFDPLLSLLTADNDTSVRWSAALALSNLGDERVVDVLIRTLKDHDPELRELAASCLGRLRVRRTIDPLIVALEDEDPGVRYSVINALGVIGGSEALAALERVHAHDTGIVDRSDDEGYGGPEALRDVAGRAIELIKWRSAKGMDAQPMDS